MTALLGLLPLIVSGQQLTLQDPSSLAWGPPSNGLRFGFRIETQKDGPAILRTWLKNESDRAMVVVARDPNGPPPAPTFIMTSKQRDQTKWIVTPPSAYPAASYGSVWQIRVPAHGIAAVQVSQFRFPVPVGTYILGSRFDASAYPDGAANPLPAELGLDSPYCTYDVMPKEVAKIAGF